MELAAAEVLSEKGVKPDAVAGFSLGEVTAVTFAGLVDKKTGFSLVCRRGELMQREAEKFDTSMAAVVKLSDSQVEKICSKYEQIYPVNFNCPGQVTVSGLSEKMPEFFAEVKTAGGRAIPLKVKGAFHSPFMNAASADFKTELDKVAFSTPAVPVYSDMTAEVYGDNPAELLSGQICSPVRWEKVIRGMIESGVDTFIEIGPGATLTNMIKKISGEVKAITVTDYLKEAE